MTWSDGVPAAGLGVHVVQPRSDRPARRWPGSTGRDGVATFDRLPSGRHTIELLGEPQRDVELAPGERGAIELVAERGFGADGRVIDAGGTPVPGAVVWRSPDREPPAFERAAPIAVADADGHFRAEAIGVPCDGWLAARAAGHASSPWLFVLARDATEAATTLRGIELRLRDAPVAIAGRCARQDGGAVADAVVRVERLAPALIVDGDRRLWPGHEDTTLSAADGTFGFADLPAGTWSVDAAADGLHFPAREVTLDTPRSRVDVELVGTVAASLLGTVRNAAGDPLPGSVVRVRGDRDARATTDTEGRFVFHDLAPGEAEVRASAPAGYRGAVATVELAPGIAQRLDLELEARPRLAGVARATDGSSLAGWRLGALRVGADGPLTLTELDASGAFDIAVDDVAPHWFRIAAPGVRVPTLLGGLGAFTPQDTSIELRVPASARAAAWITGSLPPPGADRRLRLSLVSEPPYRFDGFDVDAETGAFRVGPLPAGRYTLHVDGRALAPGTFGRPLAGELRLASVELAHGQALDLGRLALPQPGALALTIRSAPGCAPRGVRLQWSAADGSSWGFRDVPADFDDSVAMLPGVHRLFVWGEGFLPVEREVTVLPPPAPPARLEVMLRGAERLPVRFELPAGEDRATVIVRDETGAVVHEDELDQAEAGTVVRWPVLGLGRHAVELTGASGRRYHGSFVVGSLRPTRVPLVIE
ncbi:MAG: carboxypeptidase regulatory-like domain-containing protein [Planctomycetes bacterium]|nr:carboxypeptidase regulatory-like domain-containing protein [Planctomycetota bacterium]